MSERKLSGRLLEFSALSAEFIERWDQLEREGLERNIYLSPGFVIPAVRWLSPDEPPLVACVESSQSETRARLLGLALVFQNRRSRTMPFRHFAAFKTLHSFSDGVLLDSSAPKATATELFKLLLRQQPLHGALGFEQISIDRPVFQVLNDVAISLGFQWHELRRFERATVRLDQVEEQQAAKSECKRVMKARRKLTARGEVKYRLITDNESAPGCVDRHLELEHMGWKGSRGTSMLSRPHEEKFFREMIAAFLEKRRACFSEIVLNDRVISSSSNLISGEELFAFKIGWDPAFAKYSPGIMNEMAMLNEIRGALPEITRMDSGTSGPSYIDRIWRGKESIGTGFFAMSRRSKAWLDVAASAWLVRRRAKKWLQNASGRAQAPQVQWFLSIVYLTIACSVMPEGV